MKLGPRKQFPEGTQSLSAKTRIKQFREQQNNNAGFIETTKNLKRSHQEKVPGLSDLLYTWFIRARSLKINISYNILKRKSLELAKGLGNNEFKGSNGFIDKWLNRYNIALKGIHGEAKTYNEASLAEWKDTTLPTILSEYSLSDIYNADETALFYKQLPDKTYEQRGVAAAAVPKSKQRLTVLLCTNASGTDKCTPLVIGKFSNPRCFKSIKHFPVIYKANQNSWMTRLIFDEYIAKWDEELIREGRKICLVIDNCTCHHINYIPKAIKLVFLPPNTTALLQPLDQGVIKLFKSAYKDDLIDKLIALIDAEDERENSDITDKFIKNFLLSDCLYMIKEAWEGISTTSIQNIFSKVGFSLTQRFSADQDSLELDCSEHESEDSIKEPDNIEIEDLIVESKNERQNLIYSIRSNNSESEEEEISKKHSLWEVYNACSIIKRALADSGIKLYKEIRAIENELLKTKHVQRRLEDTLKKTS